VLFPDSNASDGATEVLAFDINDGPNGFLTACEILRTMIRRRRLRAGLVIACEFENNRLLEGYPQLGIAEIASAAVIMGPAEQGAHISNCRTFSFDEHADLFRASLLCAGTPHVSVDVRDDYEATLRVCIRRAIGEYLPGIGRTLDEFDDFYFPQVSSAFLDSLAEELNIPRRRVADVTLAGRNLYTSGLPCLLERCTQAGGGSQGRLGLAVSAGPGINVGCALIRI
jgi:3-oxoacyl-[acyl-carrier-protein] synthase III